MTKKADIILYHFTKTVDLYKIQDTKMFIVHQRYMKIHLLHSKYNNLTII